MYLWKLVKLITINENKCKSEANETKSPSVDSNC